MKEQVKHLRDRAEALGVSIDAALRDFGQLRHDYKSLAGAILVTLESIDKWEARHKEPLG